MGDYVPIKPDGNLNPFKVVYFVKLQNKKEGNDQESIQKPTWKVKF